MTPNEETKDGWLKGKGGAQVSNPCQLTQLTGYNATLPRSVSPTQDRERVKMAWTHHPTPSVPSRLSVFRLYVVRPSWYFSRGGGTYGAVFEGFAHTRAGGP